MSDYIKGLDEYDRIPTVNETLSIADSVKTLTAATYLDAPGANIFVENAPIRFWVNGIAPSSSVGILVNAGGSIELGSAAEIAGFKAIATTETAAILQIAYWR